MCAHLVVRNSHITTVLCLPECTMSCMLQLQSQKEQSGGRFRRGEGLSAKRGGEEERERSVVLDTHHFSSKGNWQLLCVIGG